MGAAPEQLGLAFAYITAPAEVDIPTELHDQPAVIVAGISDEAIAAIAARAAQVPASPSQIFIVPWGGQLARVGPETSPLAGREAAFIVHPLLLWEDAADDERMLALGRALREDMRPFSTGATYLNFLGDEGGDRVRAGFAPGAYDRLTRIKAEWDPDGVFHGNQTLPR